MSSTASSRLAWTMWLACMLLMIAAVVLLVQGWNTPVPVGWGFRGAAILFALPFSTVGLAVAIKRPGNVIGWVFLTCGALLALEGLCIEYAGFSLLQRDHPLAGAVVLAWLANWTWVPFMGLIGIGLFMLFPDGRFLSSAWRRIGILCAGVMAIMTVTLALEPGPLQSSAPYITTPYSVEIFQDASVRYTFMVSLVFVVSAVSQIMRYRRADSVTRQQLKWLASAAVIAAFALSLNILEADWAEYLGMFGIGSLPIVVGIAILRYRLYDIDILINRTLVYGSLTATLAVAYFGSVVALQSAFRSVAGQESSIAVVVSTLAIAALFGPLRRRIQAVIDRRFYRNRYDAARALAAFSATAKDEVDLERLSRALMGVAQGTVQPAHVSLWLTETGRANGDGRRNVSRPTRA